VSLQWWIWHLKRLEWSPTFSSSISHSHASCISCILFSGKFLRLLVYVFASRISFLYSVCPMTARVTFLKPLSWRLSVIAHLLPLSVCSLYSSHIGSLKTCSKFQDDGASDGFFGSSREFVGFLQRVTMVCVFGLHLLSHSGWSHRKKKSWEDSKMAAR
jgi:hypothetical protein